MKLNLKRKIQLGLLVPLVIVTIILIVLQFRNTDQFIVDEIKQSLRGQVDIMYTPMYDKYHLHKIGVISDKNLAYSEGIKIVQNARFGEGGKKYFWLVGLSENKVMAHPSNKIKEVPSLSKESKLDLKAFNSLKEKISKGEMSGFLEFNGKNFETGKVIQKLAYYRYFKEWNWVLGTEINLSEITDKTKALIYKFTFYLLAGIVLLYFVVTLIIQKAAIRPLSLISKDLSNSSDSIKKASAKNLNTSNDMSNSSTEQSSNLQETASSVDEISAMVERNKDSTKESTEIAHENLKAVEKGRDSIKNLLASISEILKSSENTSSKMKSSIDAITNIQRVVKEIEEKTKVINDIVFQTKLLSFNASVEAARAGESGKGFAVVAEEVGNLATMSGKASDEISNLITESLKTVDGIVEEINSTSESIIQETKNAAENSNSNAETCDELFDQVYGSITILNDRINEISNASEEQSNGVREISDAMKRLDQLSLESTELAKETEVSAKNLTLNSKDLDRVVVKINRIING